VNFYVITLSDNQVTVVTENGGFVPSDSMNADYLAYVAWLFDGNTPEEWNPEQVSEEQ